MPNSRILADKVVGLLEEEPVNRLREWLSSWRSTEPFSLVI